jgi:hypothetical protein
VDIERDRVVAPAPLRWDPIRPLTGLGDWLARVRWVDGVPDRSLRPWLCSTKGHGGTVAIPAGPQERPTFVNRFVRVISDGHSEPALHALSHKERGRPASASVTTMRTLSIRRSVISRWRFSPVFVRSRLLSDVFVR